MFALLLPPCRRPLGRRRRTDDLRGGTVGRHKLALNNEPKEQLCALTKLSRSSQLS
jgi:hypothetical protein